MKTIEEEVQTNVASEIYTYIAIPINSLKQSNDIIQTVQPMQIASNLIYNVLPHDGRNEKIQTYTLTDQFIETLRENDKEHDVIENQESLRPTVIEQISNTRKSVILETSLNKDETVTYECLTCGEVFKTRQGYRKHLEKHKEKLYKCDECSASYNCEINFKLHKVVHTKNATSCPVCEKSFNRMASLKNHLTFHEIEETFTCTECWATFDAEEEYNKHIQNHKSEAQPLQIFLVCSVCDEKFEDRAKYKQHILFHTEVKKLLKIRKTPKKRKVVKRTPSHLCDVCKKSFSKYCLLIRHKRIHTGEKPYVCHYCDRAFAQKGTLRIHLKIHTGLKPFKCTICMAKFSQKCNLRAHVQRTHLHEKTSEKIYSCQLCACAFKRIASLNAHTTRFHRGDKDSNDIIDLMQQIDQLENQMNNKSNLPINDILKRNIIENDSEKFVRLADSSVEGPVQYFLVKQKKTTEGLWYSCSYCEKEFKKPSDLIRHMRIHTMQKPFKCKHCNRRFSLKSTLKNHVVSHSNFRSYECIICKTTFNSKKTLKNNSKTDDKFVCGSCKPVASDFKVKRVNVEKLEALKVLNNLNIDIELKQPMVESSEGLVPIISPKAKIHSDSANSNRPKLHRCHCGAEFFQVKKLHHHMLIHTSEKKFKCYVCNKCFHNAQTLKEHIKSVHNGERKFLCRICDKRFVTNTILKRHMITHSFVKPYICPYCKKRFKTILHCRQHIKLHKKDILLNALTADESNKFTASFVTEAALPENLFANTLPDGSYSLGLNFDNLTESTGISSTSNLLSESSESVEQNKDECETQILYTDKGNGVIVSTPLDISQTHDGKNKLEQQLLLTSTTLPSYDESTKNITTDNLENVHDSIAALPQENSTVFLNFDDLHLTTSNLYSSYPNLKNFDQLLGEISEIQDNNILLTSDSSLSQLTDSQLDTSNFDGLMPFAFNTNISLNNVTLSTTNSFPNVILSSVSEDVSDLNQGPLSDLPYDVKKSSGVEESQKMLEEKEENPLLSNLLETSSSSEPIIPNTDETIFENVDFTCSSCKKYLDNVEDLMHHYCSGKAAAEGIAKESQHDGLPSYEDSIQAKKKLKNGHKCKKCNKTFTTKLSLQKHAGFHKEKKNASLNVCSYCEKGFKKHSDLLRHVRTHTGEKPFTCDKCQKNFTLKSTLETHRRTHNPESHQKYDCGVCGTHVSSKASLRVHMMMHTGAKPYQCSVCFENFRTSGHRRSHMRTHLNNNKARKQPKSAKVTTMLQSVITETQNSEELYEEVLLLNNSQHLQENKELTLQDSEVLFPNQTVQVDSLILQQLQQSCVLLDDGNERIPPFIQVDINNYGEITNVKSIRDIQESFKTAEPDKSTENIYLTKKASPERNFECDICHKKYTTKSVLTKHKRIHDKLNCAKCNIKFTQSEELQEHLKIHNVIRPFACSLCDNSFSIKKNLLTHMKRIHSTSFP